MHFKKGSSRNTQTEVTLTHISQLFHFSGSIEMDIWANLGQRPNQELSQRPQLRQLESTPTIKKI